MAALPPLISSSDMADYGYAAVSEASLRRASTRVRRYVRQAISAGSSTVTLYASPPWLMPQRPVTAITSAVNASGQAVTVELRGQMLHTTACGPITVAYTHGHATLPDDLIELVRGVAARIAATPAGLVTGARTEQAGGEAVTWGADAYAATSGLTRAEEAILDSLYPRRPKTVNII